MRSVARWPALLPLLVACGSAAPSPTIGTSSSAAPTTRASVAPSAPLPAASVAPPAIVLDRDMVDDEPILDEKRAKLVGHLRRARHVVRGRVVEAKERTERRAGRSTSYSYAIVDIVEWLRGDVKRVERAYQQSFAVASTPIPEGVSKVPSEHTRFIEGELAGAVGKERLFLLNLPSEDGTATLEPGPPGFIVARWGKFHVGIAEHLSLDERPDLLAAIDDLARHDAWVKENARRLAVTDRFAGAATTDDAARAVLRFVTEDLHTRAGLSLTGELSPAVEERGVVKYDCKLASDGVTTRLGIQIDAKTRRVRAFRLDSDLAKARPKAAARFARDSVLEETRARLGLVASGGKLFTHAAQAMRGDGLSFVDVTIHAGMVERGGSSHASRSARVSLSQDLAVIFEYANGWSE